MRQGTSPVVREFLGTDKNLEEGEKGKKTHGKTIAFPAVDAQGCYYRSGPLGIKSRLSELNFCASHGERYGRRRKVDGGGGKIWGM